MNTLKSIRAGFDCIISFYILSIFSPLIASLFYSSQIERIWNPRWDFGGRRRHRRRRRPQKTPGGTPRARPHHPTVDDYGSKFINTSI